MKKYISFFGKRVMELLTHISPVISGKLLYFTRIKKFPNLKKPKNFNEKTTWLKLYEYSNNELVINGADKYMVRHYLSSKNLNNILNDLYGVYDSFDEIDFDKLPNQFVIKCNHGCAYNIICEDKSKFNKEEAKVKINKWLKEKYGKATTEMHYTKINPKIIIEKYLCDTNGKMPVDYKFYCLNGQVVGVLICTERKFNSHIMHQNYYDINFKELFYIKEEYRSKNKITKPKNFDKMVEYAKILSKDFPFVRVDFYNDNGKIIFGELTFTPACCCNNKYSDVGNIELGNLLDISKNIIKYQKNKKDK